MVIKKMERLENKIAFMNLDFASVLNELQSPKTLISFNIRGYVFYPFVHLSLKHLPLFN